MYTTDITFIGENGTHIIEERRVLEEGDVRDFEHKYLGCASCINQSPLCSKIACGMVGGTPLCIGFSTGLNRKAIMYHI